MGLFDPETGIGVNYSGYGLEFSMGFSAKIRFRGFLSQKCVGWAVTYPRISGNIVFKWPMLDVVARDFETPWPEQPQRRIDNVQR